MPKILIKRGSATQWTNSSTPLASGELGLDTTNNILKVGNGTTLWNSLSGLTLTSTQVSELAQDAIKAAIDAGTHTNMSVVFDDEANTLSISTGPDVVTSSSLGNSLDGYVPIGDVGNVDGVAPLDENALIPDEYISSTITRDSEVAELAQDAVGNSVGNGLDYNDETGAISVDPSEFALNSVGTPTADVSMASYKITNLGSPTSSNDAANKAYVDNTTAGLNFHAAVHAATTVNLDATYSNGTSGVGATLTATSNGALIIDGHTLNATERVLVKNQTTGLQNGIYVVTNTGDGSNPFILTRATDADNSPLGEVAYGDFVFVQNGTANAGYGYILNTTGTITLGTTSISYVQFNAGQTVIAGYGLTESSPGTFAVDTSVIQPKVTGVDDTEIGYLNGVTSAIQTQIDNKASASSLDSKLNIIEPSVDYYVTNNGSGSYTVNGVANGLISFEKGKRYRIYVNASGHPFWIQTISGAYSSGNVYNTGITGNGTAVGSIVVELPQNAPAGLYYACQFHSSMAGAISVKDAGVQTTTNPQSGSYTISIIDSDKLIEMSGGGTLTITDSSAFPTGFTVNVLQTGSSQVTIAGNGFTVNATPGLKLRERWSSATLVKRGLNSWVAMGDLSA